MGYTYEQLVKMGAKPAEPIASTGNASTAGAPKKYTYEELVKAGATPGETARVSGVAPKQEGDGIIASIVKDPIKTLLVKPAARTAEALGRMGVFGKTIQSGYEEMADTGQDLNTIAGKYHVEPVKGGAEGVKQIVGEGAKTASYLLGGAGEAQAVKSALKTGLSTAVKQGVKVGAGSGALYGGGQAAEEGKDALEIADQALKGGAAGAVAGLAIPAAGALAGKTVSRFAGGAAQKAEQVAEQAAMIENKVPDAKIATKALNTEGKVVSDPIGKEAVRQGIPEPDVALIKSATDVDKAKMVKMLDIRQNSLTNKRSIERSSDVVGDTFLEHAKFIEAQNKQAAKDLNMVASRLKGKTINPENALSTFAGDLETAGIKVRGKTLNFRGSDFEGIGPAQTAIRNVYERALRLAKTGDALEAHRLKRYIDEIVDYGKNAEGLSGRAQKILKGLRHAVDETLDKKFSTYDRFNTIYAETIQEMSKIADALGHSFKAGQPFANAKAGVAMRKIISNSQTRAGMLQLLESMQKVSKKYGMKSEDDIITQTLFADTLEKMFGSEAPASFLGQIEKGVDRAGEALSAGGNIIGGNPVAGTIKAGKLLIDMTRGVNQDAKIKALRELLKGSGKPPATSIFGKPINPAGKGSPSMGEIGKDEAEDIFFSIDKYKGALPGSDEIKKYGEKILALNESVPAMQEVAKVSQEKLKKEGIEYLYRYGDSNGLSWSIKPDSYYENNGKRQLQKVKLEDVIDRVIFADQAQKDINKILGMSEKAKPINSREMEVFLKPFVGKKGLFGKPSSKISPSATKNIKWKDTADKGAIPGEAPISVLGNPKNPKARIIDVEGEDGVALIREDGTSLMNPKTKNGMFGNIEEAKAEYATQYNALKSKGYDSNKVKTTTPATKIETKSTEKTVPEAEAGDVIYLVRNLIVDGRFDEARKLWRELPKGNEYKEGMRSFFEYHKNVPKIKAPKAIDMSGDIQKMDINLIAQEARKYGTTAEFKKALKDSTWGDYKTIEMEIPVKGLKGVEPSNASQSVKKDLTKKITEPIEVLYTPNDDDKWVVVDGNHRLQQAILNGQTTIKARVGIAQNIYDADGALVDQAEDLLSTDPDAFFTQILENPKALLIKGNQK